MTMDNLEDRLKSDPISSASVISKLVQEIQKSGKAQGTKELQILKDKCASGQHPVNLAAADALYFLVKLGALEHAATAQDLITSLPNALDQSGIVKALWEILVHQYETAPSSFKYELCSPQHPLVTVLQHNQGVWPQIHDLLQGYCEKGKNCQNGDFESTFLRPVVYFLMLDRGEKFLTARKQLFNLLVKEIKDADYFYELFSWMRIDGASSIEIAEFIFAVAEANPAGRLDLLSMLLVENLHGLICSGCDPKRSLHHLVKLVDGMDPAILEPILLGLSNCLSICPSGYLRDLLEVCLNLCVGDIHLLTLSCLQAGCIPWMMQPCLLTEECRPIFRRIFTLDHANPSEVLNYSEVLNNVADCHFLNTLERMSFNVELCGLIHGGCDWMAWVEKVPENAARTMMHFLSGLLIQEGNEKLSLATLKLLVRVARALPDVCEQLLPLILYKMARSTDSALHLELWRALPVMGSSREELPTVVGALRALLKGPEKLQIFALSLFYDLWVVQVRTYPLLQKILVENAFDSWEGRSARAFILKELCEKRFVFTIQLLQF